MLNEPTCKPMDRYTPPTGFRIGQRVVIKRGSYLCEKCPRRGTVTGFGNPTFTPERSVRVRFDSLVFLQKKSSKNRGYRFTFPVTSLRKTT